MDLPMPFCFHPVLLTKLAKTNLAFSCVGARAGTTIKMTKKDTRDVYSVAAPRAGKVLP